MARPFRFGIQYSGPTDRRSWRETARKAEDLGYSTLTCAAHLDDQFALEVFYRAAAGKHLALTVDLQYIQDPAINPAESSIWMFNLRGRVVF